MGTYLNSITPYTLYKSECLSAYFVDKTLMLRELFPYVSAGNRHICITDHADSERQLWRT